MKGPVRNPSTYQFNAADRSLTFLAPIPTFQGQILGAFNITRQTWIYLPQKVGANGISYAGTWSSPTLTLAFDTTAHSSTDVLQIFYDDGLTAQSVAPDVALGGGAITAKTQRFTLATDDSIATALGSDGTSPPTLPGSSTGIRGWLRYLASLLPQDAATANNQQAANELLTESNSYLPFVVDYTGSTQTRLGTTGTGAPTLPSGASGLAGLVQVFYQALLDRLPATLSGGRLQVAPSLATDAATATNQETINNRLGTTNETPPNSDTASAGLNGRMQRLAQRLSSILLKLPAFGTAGTPSADVLTVQGVSSGTPLRIASGVLGEFAYNSGTNIIAGNTQLMLIDCSNCSAVSIQVTSFATSGGIVAEWSNNGINFGIPQTLQQFNTSTQWGTTINGVGTYIAPRMGKWLQLRQSTASTGGSNTSIIVTQLSDSPAVSAIVQLVGGSANIIGSVVQGYSAATAFTAATKYSVFSVAGTNAAVVKNSPGKVIGFWFTNTTANFVAIRLYNLTVAPTVGTSATFTRIVVPPNACFPYNQEGGYLHSVGIAIAITAGLSDNDNTAVAAGAIIGELFTI
jgi:hypothetical protein